ncbi:MAG TPA: hypothetical protein VGM80_15250 [Gaiellaceae bacterium]|jgi:hypothetical protein
MGVGVSLILAAGGAVLIWAVNTTSTGFNIHAAGVILLVVGIIGFCLSLAFWSSWGGWMGTRETPARTNDVTVIDR